MCLFFFQFTNLSFQINRFRFEETNRYSAPCTETQSKIGQCYGGFPRLATLIEQARNSSTPTLFMNGGDTYQGTVYYTKFKWRMVTKMLNMLSPDVVVSSKIMHKKQK